LFKRGENLYIDKDYNKNIKMFKEELAEGENFDVIIRDTIIVGKKASFICIDGFFKDDILTQIMQTFLWLRKNTFTYDSLQSLLENTIPYMELSTENKIDELLYSILSGAIILIVDGSPDAFVIDARTYPARTPEEPDVERVVRGSRDGFTETIVFNTVLLRRRVRDPKLRFKLFRVGKRSKSDVCVCYIKDIANPEMVQTVIDKIQAIDIDAIPMAEKSIEELIVPGNVWNPFPRVRYTERPDVAAVHLFEGHVLVMVDTSPSVIILPVTYFHHIQHAEEYRQNPTVGTYIRLVRFMAIAASLIVTPLWLLFALSPEILPESLKFIGPREVGKVPIFLQFLIGEVSLDLIRIAAIHTPSPLATALGVIAALLIGQIAVDIGLLIPEVILYTAVVAIGTFSTPSYEMAMANRLVRLFIVVGTGILQLPGLIGATIIAFFVAAFTKSFGVPYLWPLIPLNIRALKDILVRSPVPMQNLRPEFVKPQDQVRQPSPAFKKRR